MQEALWVGSETGMEADLVKRAGVDFTAIPAAGLHGVGLRALPGNALQLGRGYRAAARVSRRFRPDGLFFTGGYVAVPVALAARDVPRLMFVPDIEPGLALKFLARFADRIAVVAEDSRAFFPPGKEVTVTGYPVRQELLGWEHREALEAFGLTPSSPVVLVFGGSRGARSINRALFASLSDLLERTQVIHLTGALDWPEVEPVRAGLGADIAARYHPFPYLHERMGAALRVADLVVSRAGASTLGEFPAHGLPAVLVPYPHAWRYQRVNAAYLARHGAAEVLADEHLDVRLVPRVLALIEKADTRERMARAMRDLATPEAADHIGAMMRALVETGPGRAEWSV